MNYYTVEYKLPPGTGARRRLQRTLISADTQEDAEVLARALLDKKPGGTEITEVHVYHAGRAA